MLVEPPDTGDKNKAGLVIDPSVLTTSDNGISRVKNAHPRALHLLTIPWPCSSFPFLALRFPSVSILTILPRFGSLFVRTQPQPGDDLAEDVAGGLHLATELDWRSSVRLCILIADAPCHGKEYNSGIGDTYARGCPKGRDPSKLVYRLQVRLGENGGESLAAIKQRSQGRPEGLSLNFLGFFSRTGRQATCISNLLLSDGLHFPPQPSPSSPLEHGACRTHPGFAIPPPHASNAVVGRNVLWWSQDGPPNNTSRLPHIKATLYLSLVHFTISTSMKYARISTLSRSPASPTR